MNVWKKLEVFAKLGDLFLKYKPILIFLIGIIPTGSYGIFSYFQIEEKTKEVKATQGQVAQVAQAYQTAYVEPDKKPVIKSCNCEKCTKDHEARFHGKY